jgi:subtilase family serine protease
MLRRLERYGLLLALAVSFGAGVGQGQTVLTRHVRDAVRNGSAKLVGHMPANQVMSLVIVLPLRNQNALDQFLKDVYDPANPSYRHFLTVDQFTAKFGPTQTDYDAVKQFAQENGLTVTGTSSDRLNLDVSGTAANVEKAFNVKLNMYQHPTEARTFFSPDREPTTYLPFSLWRVAGLDNYSLPRPAGLSKNPNARSTTSNATVGSGPSQSFLGSDMRAAYYGQTALTGSGQSLGLLEYYGTDLADVTTYYNNVHQTNSVPINLLSTDGSSTSCLYSAGCDDTEQTLDITQALGMAPQLTKLDVYVGGTDASILNAMLQGGDAQLSCSWAWNPADPGVDDPYYQGFAADGQNFFVAAGDYGAWPTPRSPYYYPAEDAYVTAVGGTDLTTSSAAGPWASESAWSSGGGGISPDNIAIPSWQTQTATSCSTCSKTYRNAPDVSANANFTFYVCADQTTCTANQYGGTSFAAPMWAGYMALVNQQSVANGSGRVGFINPNLYAFGNSGNYSTDFHDITSGSNGYSATTGYDLATGWGSPNGTGLINALSGPAAPGFSLSASPSSLSVVQGNSGSTKVTLATTGGFSSQVTLSTSGAPSGVSTGFSVNPISGNGSSSTLTFTVASTVAAGSYTITVTGTPASGTPETTTVTLTVTAPPPVFSLSAASSSISVKRGSSTSDVITVTLVSGGAAPVTLSASGLEKGVSASFSTNPVTPTGTSTMKVSANRKASATTFTITVTGTATGATPVSIPVSVTVH